MEDREELVSDPSALAPTGSPENGATGDDVRASIRARLRQKHEELGQEHTTELAITGYEDELIVRYKWIPPDTLSAGSQKLMKIKNPTQRNLLASCDTLIRTCDSIHLALPSGGLVNIAERDQEVPTKWGDERISEFFGFNHPDNTRAQVRAVYKNDYALMRQAIAISRWLEDTSQEVDENFMGE